MGRGREGGVRGDGIGGKGIWDREIQMERETDYGHEKVRRGKKGRDIVRR